MKAFGFSRDDIEGGPVAVWPDNWAAVDLFLSMGTQWRIGPNGPTGLDYVALESVLRMHEVPKRDRRDVLESVRILESEALRVMREK